jgi:hypothetical protein
VAGGRIGGMLGPVALVGHVADVGAEAQAADHDGQGEREEDGADAAFVARVVEDADQFSHRATPFPLMV